MGIMLIKPLKATEPITPTASVNIETAILLPTILSPVRPAMPAAVGASSRPITAMIAPMAAGGKITSIHLVPTIWMIKEKSINNKPKTMKPLCA